MSFIYQYRNYLEVPDWKLKHLGGIFSVLLVFNVVCGIMAVCAEMALFIRYAEDGVIDITLFSLFAGSCVAALTPRAQADAVLYLLGLYMLKYEVFNR